MKTTWTGQQFVLAIFLLFYQPAFAQSDLTESSDVTESALEEEVTLDGPATSSPTPTVPDASAYSPTAPAATVESPSAPVEEEALTEAASNQEEQQEQGEEQEEEVQTATAAPTAVSEPAAKETASRDAALDADELGDRRLYGSRMFGSQKVQIGFNRPSFTEHRELREKLYGKSSDYLTLGGDWFPLDWWVNPGVTFKMGGYSVSGKAIKGSPTQEQIDSGKFEVDQSSKTTLLFIPLMVGAKIEMTPFRRKWIVLDGWVGYEYGWWQETRDNGATTTATGSISLADTTSEPVKTSKGNKRGIVFGASANFLLNWLEERTVRSMVDTIGISSVYLTTFFEAVRPTSTDGLTFGRNTIGLGFTFESIK